MSTNEIRLEEQTNSDHRSSNKEAQKFWSHFIETGKCARSWAKQIKKVSSADILICGLDEAGRGALAGPLVLSAVVFPIAFVFSKKNSHVVARDSKQLTKKQRDSLFQIIKNRSIRIETEIISTNDIDANGINWAQVEGFRRLISKIDATFYIVDGRWILSGLGDKANRSTCVIHADEYIPSTLAAGIVAKIKRDEIMEELHSYFPAYGWKTNTGHGTKQHIESILEHGLCQHHRKQFVETALRNKESRVGSNNKRS